MVNFSVYHWVPAAPAEELSAAARTGPARLHRNGHGGRGTRRAALTRHRRYPQPLRGPESSSRPHGDPPTATEGGVSARSLVR